ncbi:hypothetical protein OG563_29115 [Nocardia vinacea]|uniref:Secreted protein n=1 Tax=Nocardia vinacea TaxID=96468 RepID=A0ABZ1YNF0_9NOCA|nr:hypothetical protein [Nocardia vinacea]
MRYNAIRAAVTVVALSAALLGGQTLTTTPVAQAAGGVCTFAFNKNPYVQHEAVIVGGMVKCEPAPIAFRIELRLWHRSGTSNPQQKGDPAISTQIPNPHLNVAAMALDCVPGVWQGKIVMRATWDTGTDEGRNETLPTFLQC